MLKNKVLNILKSENLILSSDKVLVAVSGGPDSMCLLHILNEIKQDIGFDLLVAHVNYFLRKDSTEDAAYIEDFCKKNKITFFQKEINIEKFVKEEKIGIEEAARIVRYDFFEEIANKENVNKIAIAHNKNDVAETLIMNVLRGSGTNGLKSIQKVSGKYIRPLIEVEREEIEEYCKKNKINPRIDSTNSDNTYTRNKIRNIVIPYIKKEFNPNIVDGLSRLSRNSYRRVELH
ncbi:MAG: tRNA lysidine(34) synthetase TilS [Oscillospiraceae bacterium]|nr:tRNA lysidine(34) synthetase TilS [Oscillospiraceae bacterium]